MMGYIKLQHDEENEIKNYEAVEFQNFYLFEFSLKMTVSDL